jgi:uncharacterized protein
MVVERTLHLYLSFILLQVTAYGAAAQQKPEQATVPAVRVIANPKENEIMLRWAPTTPPAWQYANQYGYTVQRITLVRNNVPLKVREKITLAQAIMPQPLAAWEAEVKKNKYAAVAAQALYGKRFEVSQQGSGMAQMMNQAKESEQRFSFTLFAADYSPVVAAMCGLAFTDTHSDPNAQYLYKVWVNMKDSRYPIDTGYVYTGLKNHRPLPMPPQPEVQFMDRQAVISWKYALQGSTYIAYVIERSSGGAAFNSISSEPIVPTENTATPTGIIHVIDTLQGNGIAYTYRVKGISAFGETGPASPATTGHGKRSLSAAPAIRKITVVDNKQVTLQWEYPAAQIEELTGFQVERSFSPNGKFESVSPVLKPETNEFTDASPGASNYYRVAAMNAEDKTFSFPHQALLTDSIPPSAPRSISGTADTLGIVSLHWESNTEDDLLGYRVYRSNFDSHEYGQVTVSPLTQPFFTDTINLKTLTRNVYYKVVAVDKHFNPSKFSDAVEVQRPDVLPPSTPAFRTISYLPGKGVIIAWTASSSADIKQHLLYRRTTLDNTWRLVKAFTDTTSHFADTQVQNKNVYEYILVAADQSGLESKPAAPVRITVNDRSNKPPIDKFSAEAEEDKKQIRLTWRYDEADVLQFQIYRHGPDGKMRLFESVPATLYEFSDRQLTVNTQYQYSIKAVFRDGAQSPFSKVVKVTY